MSQIPTLDVQRSCPKTCLRNGAAYRKRIARPRRPIKNRLRTRKHIAFAPFFGSVLLAMSGDSVLGATGTQRS